MEDILTYPHKVLLVGDYNIQFDNSVEFYTAKFIDILSCFSLHQHVDSPTHVSNHILDLII